jgi:hypothetical protein
MDTLGEYGSGRGGWGSSRRSWSSGRRHEGGYVVGNGSTSGELVVLWRRRGGIDGIWGVERSMRMIDGGGDIIAAWGLESVVGLAIVNVVFVWEGREGADGERGGELHIICRWIEEGNIVRVRDVVRGIGMREDHKGWWVVHVERRG